MDKIIVQIKCPVTSADYEFRISKKLLTKDGIVKIISQIRNYEKNDNLFADTEDVHLFDDRINAFLNNDFTFMENGVKSGDTLMII